jgi:hypothetical protein
MLSELDNTDVRGRLVGSKGSLEIVFHPAIDEGVAFEEPLAAAARQIEGASGGAITAKRGDGAGLAAQPCLTIAHRGLGMIHYQAVPDGPEAPPFVEALLGPSWDGATESWVERLSALKRPAELLVFIGATCAHCPGAARSANRIALATPLVTVSIVDVQRHPTLAERFKVRAVPLTVLDGDLALTGVVRPAELVEKILSRDDERHGKDVLLSLVEQGRFEEVAHRMRTGPGAAQFLASWSGSTTSLRIGLLTAVEEALEIDRTTLDDLVASLLPILHTEDAALRGDTADLLGKIGHRAATDSLKALLQDPNPDVAEIASEALEDIDQRNRD